MKTRKRFEGPNYYSWLTWFLKIHELRFWKFNPWKDLHFFWSYRSYSHPNPSIFILKHLIWFEKYEIYVRNIKVGFETSNLIRNIKFDSKYQILIRNIKVRVKTSDLIRNIKFRFETSKLESKHQIWFEISNLDSKYQILIRKIIFHSKYHNWSFYLF